MVDHSFDTFHGESPNQLWRLILASGTVVITDNPGRYMNYIVKMEPYDG